MRIVHLTSSTFFGGPERQMLGLARALPRECQTSFLSFSEGGRCQDFLRQVRFNGFAAEELRHDTPNLPAAALELTRKLVHADVLLCHGYKANLIGRLAARPAGIPAVAVSRGWTGEDRKVRAYEALDRLHLRLLDHVICVSEGQARKVRRAGMPPKRVSVICNAARLGDVRAPDSAGREQLQKMFFRPGDKIVLAAGRLSPEKGFDVLINAAQRVIATMPEVRVAIFGEGTQRPLLQRLIDEADLNGLVVLPGFRTDLDQLMACADLFVNSSFTEGLPNVVLEASAAAVPVVATAVGGTPEVVVDSQTGFLVPPGDGPRLAERMLHVLADAAVGQSLGRAGREFVHRHFTFASQAQAYLQLFARLGVRQSRRAVA